jgi:hypothetical protein
MASRYISDNMNAHQRTLSWASSTYLIPCWLHHQREFPLMMETASISETSLNFYQTTRRNNPEDSHLHARRRENLISNKDYWLHICRYHPYTGMPSETDAEGVWLHTQQQVALTNEVTCVLIRRRTMIVQLVWLLISVMRCARDYKRHNYKRWADRHLLVSGLYYYYYYYYLQHFISDGDISMLYLLLLFLRAK